MKPENIEARKRKRKREAVRGVLLFALLQVLTAACIGGLAFLPGSPRWLNVIWLTAAAVCLLAILPAALVLKERFREIEGGELDAAAEY